ncbi:MAG: ChbG/HpnK family deacetylase [Bacteroidales bacterium]|nr:ChbG/HpnK family deacetylase [Bacteroidales bacterium]
MKKYNLTALFILVTTVTGFTQKFNPEKEVYLLIRGDDIGSSHAANVGCMESYQNGIMQSVELMPPCPWFPEAVKMLKDNPDLDVGIHLVLTSEWDNIKWGPLTDAPSISDEDGYFYPLGITCRYPYGSGGPG